MQRSKHSERNQPHPNEYLVDLEEVEAELKKAEQEEKKEGAEKKEDTKKKEEEKKKEKSGDKPKTEEKVSKFLP